MSVDHPAQDATAGGSTCVSREDIIVDRPIPREVLRSIERGILVTCTDMDCAWQGLFPDPRLAKAAVEAHYDHEQRSGTYHYGKRTYTIVRLLDDATAQVVDDSQLGLSVEEIRLGTPAGDVREPTFPRTTGDVSELVSRGDLIEQAYPDEAVVHSVTETRSTGLPTWTVIYVATDVDLASATRTDFKWLNELVAQDGAVYRSFGEDPLNAPPAFEVIGEAEHQADLARFEEVAPGDD